ncbi:MAG: DUF748 domain-containing protein [Proteobacteria bacterium]|nr:DUF748 domain-containing protein [Pseudomonadota bacterium]
MTEPVHIKKILGVFTTILVLYTLTGFFLVPWVGEKAFIKGWGDFMGRRVAVESISTNPFSLTLLAKKISIKEETGDSFVSVGALFIDFSIASLFKLSPVCTRFEMDSPVVNLVLKKDNTFNISDLMAPSEEETRAAPQTDQADQKIFGLKLSNGNISNGNIIFSDQIREKDHYIENLNLDLPFLSTMEKDRDTRVLGEADFLLNKAKIKIGLESLPFSAARDTLLTLKTGPIDFLNYLSYLPLPKSLLVNHAETFFDLSMAYSQTGEKPSLVLKGSAGLSNIDIRDMDHTPILNAPHISFTIDPSAILEKKIRVSGLKILSPKLHLSRDADGNLNLLKYLPGEEDSEKKVSSEQNTDMVFQLDSGEIKEGVLFFTDASGKTPFETTLAPVSIKLKQFLAKEDVQGEFAISLDTEAHESLSTQGRFSTGPLGIEGTVRLEKLSIPKFAPYYENLINFDIQEGQAHLDAGFSLKQTGDNLAIVIENKQLRFTDFRFWDRVNKELPVIIPELILMDSVLDTEKKRLDLGKITTSQGRILLKRQADASINLVKNLVSGQTQAPVHKNAADEKNSSSGQSPPVMPDLEGNSPPWQISLSSLAMDNFSLAFSDIGAKVPVAVDLSDIRIQANGFNSLDGQKTQIDAKMKWNKSGKIEIKGSLLPSPFSADLDLLLDKIDIHSLEPYFADQVNIAIPKGFFQAQGHIALQMNQKPPAAAPFFTFKGKAFITDFVSLDKGSGTLFFKCNSLYFSGTDVSLFPVKVSVKEISLTDFYSRIIISDKGNINLRQILVQDEKLQDGSDPGTASAKDKQKAMSLPEIGISNVTLQGGIIEYTDYFTRPNVTAEMKEIAGQIKGLSSSDGSIAQMQLRGLHGKSSPLEISGRISPLTPKKFYDLDISFKDIELPRFSPYAAKYIGYKIEKGKLVLNLKYKIDGNKLESQNRLFLDQFTLGEKVESKDATNLPVPLAISLLKNAKNQIDLNLPVNGDIGDPKFSFSSAIFGVFGNLIMKVVAAPFKFLGAIFEGGEELGFINFEFGSDVLKEDQIEKLDQLVHILVEKKELKLVIIGTYDRNQDSQILRESRYEALLKSERVQELVERKTLSMGDVTRLPGERESAILAAYELADFLKPMDKDGREKEVSIQEKEKLLVTHVDITENDLKKLAMDRAENIQAYLLSTAKIQPARLFLSDPDALESEADQQGFGKVNFSIK